MSVEQTTQLIQLILNSVLMTVVCALLLGCIRMRSKTLEERLQSMHRQCTDLIDIGNEGRGIPPMVMQKSLPPLRENRLLQTKKHLRQLQHRHTIVNYGLLASHYSLLFSGVSTFTLALRTLINFEWLIPAALGFFVLSVSTLLFAVGLTLIDLHTSDRSLWEEVTGLLTFNRTDEQAHSNRSWRQSRAVDHSIRGNMPPMKHQVKQPRARVG